MKILETERLLLRWATPDDAAFILALVTDEAWTRNIGKSKVTNLEEAAAYIERTLTSMYAKEGFGLYVMELKAGGEAVGLCGLIRRDSLEDVDLGFALLPEHRRRGLTLEAARATLEYGRDRFGLSRIVAITSLENPASVALLEKLGFRYEKLVPAGTDGAELRLFGISV